MSTRKMIPDLVHKWAWSSDNGKFFAEIDQLGGWPVGYQFVGFEHTEERAAGFCNSPHNDGWWTVLADADEYYLWKVSPAAMQRVVDAVVEAIRLPRPNVQGLRVRDRGGYSGSMPWAATQAGEGGSPIRGAEGSNHGA